MSLFHTRPGHHASPLGFLLLLALLLASLTPAAALFAAGEPIVVEAAPAAGWVVAG